MSKRFLTMVDTLDKEPDSVFDFSKVSFVCIDGNDRNSIRIVVDGHLMNVRYPNAEIPKVIVKSYCEYTEELLTTKNE